jgi:hypothetical protein
VQLLVAVKKRRTRIVRRKIRLDLFHGGDNDHVPPNARRCFAGEPGQLKGVPMQVDRVRFITLVIEAQAVPSIGTDSNRIGLREFLYIEPKAEPRQYDAEVLLALHGWDPYLSSQG